MTLRVLLALSCAILPAVSGQALPSFILAMTTGPGVVQVQVPPNAPRAVAGAPFSAIETQESERPLPDGTRRTVTSPPQRIYRDAAGRTRIENPRVVEINDPAAGVYYLLDVQSKTAHTVKYRTQRTAVVQGQRGMPGVSTTLITPGGPAGGSPIAVTESLGTRTIQGVQAEGKRSTVTMGVNPARSQETLSRVTETWYSPDLQIELVTTITDARAGNSRFEVTGLTRDTPDPKLFQPPADYRTVDQPAFFLIEVK